MSLVAEDGNPYPYPKEQYSLLLSQGKTLDAMVLATSGGEFPVYDRRLGLTNNATPSGGMLSYLSVVPDFTLPTGSVVINNNDAATNSRDVILTLNATDPINAVTSMRFSWDNTTWSAWEAYATTANAAIPVGPNGTKTIYVQFRDVVGNVSISYSDSIEFTDVAPPTGSVVINGGAAATNSLAVALTLSATDLDNAVTDMRFSWDDATWLDWETYATTRNITIPDGLDGTKTIYVQFRDAVGNVSISYSDSILLDRAAPTGSVSINGGAASTANRAVNLTLSAADTGSPVTDMQFSWNGETWTAWQAYATTANATIPGPNGPKIIRVRFRDAAGNVSAIYRDSILFSDATPPTGSVLINDGAATTSSRTVTLTLNATDTGSPVTRMRFSWNGITWSDWRPYATTRTATLPAGAGTKTIYVRFRDASRNVSPTYSDSINYAP